MMTFPTDNSLAVARKRFWKGLFLLFLLANNCVGASVSPHQQHSNHAVIVSSSRYWFNYRHVVNALSIYQLCKSNGIPDSNIILMLADELPANARNPSRNRMTADGGRTNLYTEDIEIDYRGDEVTVDNLVKVLLGKQHGTKALYSDENSHVLVYWTGHGGDSFFKFQDVEEITSTQIANVFQQMYNRKRYKELLFLADTCQAFTLGNALTEVPNVYMVGSSLKNENSYAHHSDATLGLSVIERYTHALVQFLEKKNLHQLTLKQGLVNHLDFSQQRAHVGYREGACERTFSNVLMSDFFCNTRTVSMKPMYQENVTNRIPWEPTPNTSGRQLLKHKTDNVVRNATCTAQNEVPPRFQGVESSDPVFLVAVLSLVAVIIVGSRFI
jgi:phosphatidylinositol glycan class K